MTKEEIENYDIVVVGAGPVGLLLSVCLSRWGYKIKHIDNRPVPTATGRADGIQPRSLEILKNLGLKRHIMAYDPARVYEVAFWDPQPDGSGIHRTGTWASCPKFIDARYPFTALIHQGKIERVMIDDITKHGTNLQRPWTIVGFENDGTDSTYPVRVDLKNLDSNVIETVRAKYLFDGEGAKSFVREQLGVKITHKDPIAHVWGVMDGVIRTNFPDIKMKCTIHSDAGSIMVIPRENNMVRLYIQIASSGDKDWDPRKTATVKEVQDAAIRIMKPYHLEWDRVEWYSVYPIGQGIAEKYTLDHRIFMGGDCCHTHSPKAGQGMNTAFHDAVNFAWKMHLVESGLASRSILESYETERKHTAETLLNLDAEYAALFSQRKPSASEVGSANQSHTRSNSNSGTEEKNPFVEAFKANCEFTSGFGVAYNPNIFNWSPGAHPAQSSLFLTSKQTKVSPGRIMHPANVTRVADANVVHLENEIPFNGSFRIFIFGGVPSARTNQALNSLFTQLSQPSSFYTRHSHSNRSSNSASATVDRYHERHNPHSPFFTLALVLSAPRASIEIADLHPVMRAYGTHVYADDIWDARVPDAKAAAHAKMGFDQDEGGVLVCRPDGHVACTTKLVEGSGTAEALEEYFRSWEAGANEAVMTNGDHGLGGGGEEMRAQL